MNGIDQGNPLADLYEASAPASAPTMVVGGEHYSPSLGIQPDEHPAIVGPFRGDP